MIKVGSFVFSLDPAWPFSVPIIGWQALIVVALILVGLTLWTYVGLRGASTTRILALICVRLAALLVACIAVARPSLALQDDAHVPSTLLLAADYSESMTVQDQHKNQSRWSYLCRLMTECQPLFQESRDEFNVSVVPYRFAGDVADFDPAGKADGKRTDFGEMLNSLYERHGTERALRGLLILSDGADNGTRYPALPLASKWRSLPCPIHTFAFGQTTTTSKNRDIAFTGISADPSPVATKGKLTVRGAVDAPGFEDAKVRVHLLINDTEVLAQDDKLARTTGNEVRLVCDAPDQGGEIKVTLKIDALPGEVTEANNEISTYVTVTKEGISVLYVEGKYRAWEPKFIRYALSEEPSIRLFETVRATDERPSGEEAAQFNFERQHYDVIILGDISARRLKTANTDTDLLAAINKQVYEKGTGLMMIGGYESLGRNSDWLNTEIAKLLPVDIERADVDSPVQMVPTEQGLKHYVMRLAERDADNAALWNSLPKLDGVSKLGKPRPAAITLAESSAGEPLLVGLLHYGNGRTLAFAGDSTWRWRRTPEGVRAHSRFWRQAVLWLAKRDEAEGNVLVIPETRRLPAGGKLGFKVKLRGKGGVEIPEKDAHFDVTVSGPDKADTKVATARESGEERGTFWKTDLPGEYTISCRGWGTDIDGKPLDNLPPARVRFVVYQDDAEMTRQAADHEFLLKLASAGGGKFHQADELRQFLKDLSSAPLPQAKQKAKLWPDWRRSPPSTSLRDQLSTLLASGVLATFALFVTLLCLEWFLRRLWGLV
jgi:uncharacterized membrane protein